MKTPHVAAFSFAGLDWARMPSPQSGTVGEYRE